MNHYYQNIGENWFSYAELYKQMVQDAEDGDIFVELGCWKGRSTCFLGVEIINSGKDIKLCAVDSWRYRPNTEQPCVSQIEFNKVFSEFLNNIRPLEDIIDVYIMETDQAHEAFDDKSIKFLFHDASHHYEDVKRDLQLWIPKVRDDGIFAGHDYFTQCHPGVKQAVDEIFPMHSTDKKQNIWIVS